jgi:hypothetical protein
LFFKNPFPIFDFFGLAFNETNIESFQKTMLYRFKNPSKTCEQSSSGLTIFVGDFGRREPLCRIVCVCLPCFLSG